MAITNVATLRAALDRQQVVGFVKTMRTAMTNNWQSLFSQTSLAGTFAGTSTTAGVVPTDATTGCPNIDSFNGDPGYIADIEGGAGLNDSDALFNRVLLADMLFKAGAYAFNANTALSAQPSYSGRLPNTDYKGTQIWMESVTTFTGVPTITVTYTNQDGTGGKIATIGGGGSGAGGAAGRAFPIPLAAGDTGVQKIDNVQSAVATVGTFNILVLRPLLMCSFDTSSSPRKYGADSGRLPRIYDTSALVVMGNSTGNSLPGNIDILATIAVD